MEDKQNQTNEKFKIKRIEFHFGHMLKEEQDEYRPWRDWYAIHIPGNSGRKGKDYSKTAKVDDSKTAKFDDVSNTVNEDNSKTAKFDDVSNTVNEDNSKAAKFDDVSNIVNEDNSKAPKLDDVSNTVNEDNSKAAKLEDDNKIAKIENESNSAKDGKKRNKFKHRNLVVSMFSEIEKVEDNNKTPKVDDSKVVNVENESNSAKDGKKKKKFKHRNLVVSMFSEIEKVEGNNKTPKVDDSKVVNVENESNSAKDAKNRNNKSESEITKFKDDCKTAKVENSKTAKFEDVSNTVNVKDNSKAATFEDDSQTAEVEDDSKIANVYIIKDQTKRMNYEDDYYLKEMMIIKCLDAREFNENMFESTFGKMVLLLLPWADPMWNIRLSCRCCNLHLSSRYDKKTKQFSYYINGIFLAMVTGGKTSLFKKKVADLGWQRLSKEVVCVIVKKQFVEDGDTRITVSEITGNKNNEVFGTPVDSTEASLKLKDMGPQGNNICLPTPMGWEQPSKHHFQMITYDDLGGQKIPAKMRPFAQRLFKRFADTEASYLDLMFSTDIEERALLHGCAEDAGLASAAYRKGSDRFMVVRKKLNLFDVARAIIEKGGSTPKYQVFIPETLKK